MKNKRFLRVTLALTLALLLAVSVVAPALAATDGREANSLTVYYVKKAANEVYLVRETHPTNHRILGWFALDEVIHGKARTPGVLHPFNPDTWVKSIVTVQGRTTVDFTAKILRDDVPWSVRQLAVQALVNTLTEFPETKQVRFTVNGVQYPWLYQYRTRDLSQVRGGEQGPVEPSISVNVHDWQWIGSPLAVRGKTGNFSGLVLVELKDYDGDLVARGWAWVGEGANGFSTRLTYETPQDWVGSLTVTTWNAGDSSKGPGLEVPVLFSRR
ncbi:MAG: GerMN domain-containing protein [Bacillota bacterium]|nr:GerMN domain-containing protein [Bacillota bacterium]